LPTSNSAKISARADEALVQLARGVARVHRRRLDARGHPEHFGQAELQEQRPALLERQVLRREAEVLQAGVVVQFVEPLGDRAHRAHQFQPGDAGLARRAVLLEAIRQRRVAAIADQRDAVRPGREDLPARRDRVVDPAQEVERILAAVVQARRRHHADEFRRPLRAARPPQFARRPPAEALLQVVARQQLVARCRDPTHRRHHPALAAE
jgi:hypothetical protein